MTVRQTDGFVMKTGYALTATSAAIGVDAAGLELLGDASDVRFTNNIPSQIDFFQDLELMSVIHRVRSISQDKKSATWKNTRQEVV